MLRWCQIVGRVPHECCAQGSWGSRVVAKWLGSAVGKAPAHVVVDVETDGINSPKAVCAVTISCDGAGTETRQWHSGCPDPMSPETAANLTSYLFGLLDTHTVVSFNSAFALNAVYNVLNPKSPDAAKVKLLCLTSRDIFFCFAANHGYFAALNSFLGNVPELERSTIAPADIPELWARKDADGRELVLARCENDAELIRQLYLRACNTGSLSRVTSRGEDTTWQCAIDDDGAVIRPLWKSLEQYTRQPPPFAGVDLTSKLHWTGKFDWS
mmetsp:Transcript_24063/g.71787  ORF Transcript_24063/g.71787 Transcript_24063/m.71787 type:complete len:270 (+) Transcript_24063:73-882(+)